jgi:hypothetical protein
VTGSIAGAGKVQAINYEFQKCDRAFQIAATIFFKV